MDYLSVLFIGNQGAVCELLERMNKEEVLPMKLAYLPYDIILATRFAKEQKPDLIVLEISVGFPVWEYMESVRTLEQQTEFLLISPEKNFEYAYLAFQHHALNFLLEPVTEQVLTQSLAEAQEKLRVAHELLQEKKKLDLYELKHHQELMEKILTTMLEKPEELELLLGEVNHRYQTELTNDNFLAIVINADRQEFYAKKSNFYQRLLPILEGAFPCAHEVIGSIILPYGITGIINFSGDCYSDRIQPEIHKLYEEILKLRKEFGTFELAIGIGSIVHTMKEISLSLQEAFRAEQYKLVSKDQRIFNAKDIVSQENTLELVLSAAQRKNLSRYLKSMEEDNLTSFFNDLLRRSDRFFVAFPEGYHLLKNQLISTAKEVWEDTEGKDYFAEEEQNILRLEHLFQGRAILEELREILLCICRRRKESGINSISEPIRIALDYIRDHYAEAVTLEELAQICGLSPNYFSAMFREQIGEPYIDYLTEQRLEKSKDLLATTGSTVKDIAEAIGYLDDKYFRKLFKNRYGITPSDYRKEITSTMDTIT